MGTLKTTIMEVIWSGEQYQGKPSKVSPLRVVETNFDYLGDIITNETWSAIQYKGHRRREVDSIVDTELLVLDFDDGMTLDEAIKEFKNYRCHICTSKSHQKEKNGKVCDRFRVVLHGDVRLTIKENYKRAMLALLTRYPQADQKCKDLARIFFASPGMVYSNPQGAFFPTSELLKAEVESSPSPKPKGAEKPVSADYTAQFLNDLMGIYLEPVTEFLKLHISKRCSITPQAFAKQVCRSLPYLMNDSQRWVQTQMASFLGQDLGRPIKQVAVSRLLHHLCEEGVITCVDDEYAKGAFAKTYGAGPEMLKLIENVEPSNPWSDGVANDLMLKTIRWGTWLKKTDQEILDICLRNQGDRPAEKMRSEVEILAAIQNWKEKQKCTSN